MCGILHTISLVSLIRRDGGVGGCGKGHNTGWRANAGHLQKAAAAGWLVLIFTAHWLSFPQFPQTGLGYAGPLR